VFETALPAQYAGNGACGGAGLDMSVNLSFLATTYAVGAPGFAVPQIVVTPGSTAKINVTYGGPNLEDLTLGTPFYGFNGNLSRSEQPRFSLGILDQNENVNVTGVTITLGPIFFHSNSTASQLITITTTPGAIWATYPLGPVGCGSFQEGGFLLTVGYLPYWQPVYWVTQLVTPISCLAIAALIVGLVAGVMRLIHRIGQIEISPK